MKISCKAAKARDIIELVLIKFQSQIILLRKRTRYEINITGVSGSRVAYYAAKETLRRKRQRLSFPGADVATRLKDDFFAQDRGIL